MVAQSKNTDCNSYFHSTRCCTLQYYKANLRQYIGNLVSRTDVENGKPHPESYVTTVSLMSVDSRNCIAFEDSYNGVRAAYNTDISTIMIPDLLPSTDEMRQKTVMVIDNLIHFLFEVGLLRTYISKYLVRIARQKQYNNIVSSHK